MYFGCAEWWDRLQCDMPTSSLKAPHTAERIEQSTICTDWTSPDGFHVRPLCLLLVSFQFLHIGCLQSSVTKKSKTKNGQMCEDCFDKFAVIYSFVCLKSCSAVSTLLGRLVEQLFNNFGTLCSRTHFKRMEKIYGPLIPSKIFWNSEPTSLL